MSQPTIHYTEDLSIFHRMLGNRQLSEPNIRSLMQSLLELNRLQYHPIVVNSAMEVIDGNHRLEAARRLNIPVYYMITEDESEDNLCHLINANASVKKWALEDYANLWAQKEPSSIYAQIIRVSTRWQIGIGSLASFVQSRMRETSKFKKGVFLEEFNKPEDFRKLDMLEHWASRVTPHVPQFSTCASGVHLAVLGKMMSTPGCDVNRIADYLIHNSAKWSAFRRHDQWVRFYLEGGLY